MRSRPRPRPPGRHPYSFETLYPSHRRLSPGSRGTATISDNMRTVCRSGRFRLGGLSPLRARAALRPLPSRPQSTLRKAARDRATLATVLLSCLTLRYGRPLVNAGRAGRGDRTGRGGIGPRDVARRAKVRRQCRAPSRTSQPGHVRAAGRGPSFSIWAGKRRDDDLFAVFADSPRLRGDEGRSGGRTADQRHPDAADRIVLAMAERSTIYGRLRDGVLECPLRGMDHSCCRRGGPAMAAAMPALTIRSARGFPDGWRARSHRVVSTAGSASSATWALAGFDSRG